MQLPLLGGTALGRLAPGGRPDVSLRQAPLEAVAHDVHEQLLQGKLQVEAHARQRRMLIAHGVDETAKHVKGRILGGKRHERRPLRHAKRRKKGAGLPLSARVLGFTQGHGG